ncbi:MAG TPA: PA2779 family protein [Vicinamibacterales bacterium]|nr:PA2779 family protein [Vicinamibacterales bacterium]
MKVLRRTLAVCLAVLFMAPTAHAQSNVITRSALDQAVQERVAQDQADREAIRSLLQREEVREIAGKAGLSLDKALAAVSTLSGDDLRELAGQSRQLDNQLAGGASTIVISTTTIIIVLLLVILIIALTD